MICALGMTSPGSSGGRLTNSPRDVPSVDRTTVPDVVRLLVSIVVALSVLATACQAQTTVEFVEQPERGERVTDIAANATNDARSSDAAAMSAAEVYDTIVDSIVFVETPEGSGTGIVIEDGWILTNAHVVERFPEDRHALEAWFMIGFIRSERGICNNYQRD